MFPLKGECFCMGDRNFVISYKNYQFLSAGQLFESNPINLHILIIKHKKFMRSVPEYDIMM